MATGSEAIRHPQLLSLLHFISVATRLPIARMSSGQLVRLDFDPDDVIVDEGCVLDLARSVEVTSNRFHDERLGTS
jgi:hypothetical protein